MFIVELPCSLDAVKECLKPGVISIKEDLRSFLESGIKEKRNMACRLILVFFSKSKSSIQCVQAPYAIATYHSLQSTFYISYGYIIFFFLLTFNFYSKFNAIGQTRLNVEFSFYPFV